jgi:O-antigen ligase
LGTISLHKLKSSPGRLAILIVLLLFSLPLGKEGLTNIILVLLFIQSLLFYPWSAWKSAVKSPLYWSSALFYIFLAISLIWSDNVDGGLRQLETKTAFFLAPLFLMAGKSYWPKNIRSQVLKAFWLGNLAAVIVALAYASWRSIMAGAFFEINEIGLPRYFFVYTHLASPLMHPGYFATYLGIGMFSAAELQYKSNSTFWKWTYRGSILFFLVFMLLLQARINLLALFLVIGLAALFFAWKRKAYIWLGLPLVPILLLSLFMTFASADLKKRYFQIPDFSYDISGSEFNSATYRLAEWKCAIAVIEQQLWLGTGIGDNREALLLSYKEHKFWEGLSKQFNAHNQYLETWIAGGAVALAFLTVLLGVYFKIAWEKGDFMALASLVFFAVCLLTESMFERAWAVLLFAIFFPLILLPAAKESD